MLMLAARSLCSLVDLLRFRIITSRRMSQPTSQTTSWARFLICRNRSINRPNPPFSSSTFVSLRSSVTSSSHALVYIRVITQTCSIARPCSQATGIHFRHTSVLKAPTHHWTNERASGGSGINAKLSSANIILLGSRYTGRTSSAPLEGGRIRST